MNSRTTSRDKFTATIVSENNIVIANFLRTKFVHEGCYMRKLVFLFKELATRHSILVSDHRLALFLHDFFDIYTSVSNVLPGKVAISQILASFILQPENLIYVPTENSFVLDLQDKIERTLKERMMEWRPRHITRWNRYCMQAFRSLLHK